jgi:hypothetical protein
MNTSTDKHKVLEYLQTGESLTSRRAMLSGLTFNLDATIEQLVILGYNIKSRTNEFIPSNGEIDIVTKYSMDPVKC